jgi:galactoside O-acetyltransferase
MKEFSGLSSGCRIICGSDEYNGEGLTNPTVPLKYRKKAKYSTIEIHSHAVLGTNCVIHPDVIIGEGAAIGSCSLVNKSLEPWNIFVGVPCRKLKERQKENILLLAKKLKSEEIDGSNS